VLHDFFHLWFRSKRGGVASRAWFPFHGTIPLVRLFAIVAAHRHSLGVERAEMLRCVSEAINNRACAFPKQLVCRGKKRNFAFVIKTQEIPAESVSQRSNQKRARRGRKIPRPRRIGSMRNQCSSFRVPNWPATGPAAVSKHPRTCDSTLFVSRSRTRAETA